MSNSRILQLLCLLILVLSTGCAERQGTHFHLLSSAEIHAYQKSTPLPAIQRIGIREIKLPGYLDRPQIVTRIGVNEIALSYAHQWAEPLSQLIVRVITSQLSARLANVVVSAYPWSFNQSQDAEIQIQINQFEIVDHQNCVLDVNWSISTHSKKPTIDHQSMISVPVGQQSYSAFVKAQSQAMSELSTQIISSLAEIKTNEGH